MSEWGGISEKENNLAYSATVPKAGEIKLPGNVSTIMVPLNITVYLLCPKNNMMHRYQKLIRTPLLWFFEIRFVNGPGKSSAVKEFTKERIYNGE